MSKCRIRGSDAIVASESQIETSAHAVALNRRVDRSRELGNGIHQSLAHSSKSVGIRSTQRTDLAKIRSHRKELLVPTKNERPSAASALTQNFRQCQDTSPRKPVRSVLRSKAKKGDFSLVLNIEVRMQARRLKQIV